MTQKKWLVEVERLTYQTIEILADDKYDAADRAVLGEGEVVSEEQDQPRIRDVEEVKS